MVLVVPLLLHTVARHVAFVVFSLFDQYHSRGDGAIPDNPGYSTAAGRWGRLRRRSAFRFNRARGGLEQGLGMESASYGPTILHFLVCNCSGGASEGHLYGVGQKVASVLLRTNFDYLAVEPVPPFLKRYHNWWTADIACVKRRGVLIRQTPMTHGCLMKGGEKLSTGPRCAGQEQLGSRRRRGREVSPSGIYPPRY